MEIKFHKDGIFPMCMDGKRNTEAFEKYCDVERSCTFCRLGKFILRREGDLIRTEYVSAGTFILLKDEESVY